MGRAKPKKVKTTERKLSPELRKAMGMNAKAQTAIQEQIAKTQSKLGNLQSRFLAEARAAICIVSIVLKDNEEMTGYDSETGTVTCQKKRKG